MIEFLSPRIFALPAAVSSGAFIALMIFRLGRKNFSPRLFGVAIATGAILSLLPATAELAIQRLHLPLNPFTDAVIKAFVLAGLGEEASKLAAAYFFVRPYYERRGRRDLVLGVASVALGFALIENVFYVFSAADRWPATALARTITAVPIHALIGLTLGAGLVRAEGQASAASRVLLIGRAWLIAATLHGLYDLPLFLGLNAPLYAEPINRFATAFSVTTPTALAAIYLVAVLAISLSAVGAVLAVWRSGPEPQAAMPARPLWPSWLRAFVFSRWTGFVCGGLLLLGAAAWIALSINAAIAGALPLSVLNALSACAASIAVGALILPPASPRVEKETRAPIKGRLAWAGVVAAAIVGLAVFAGAIDQMRRNFIAGALVASGDSYQNSGDLPQAIANFDTALSYKADFLPALIGRMTANRIYQRYDAALADANAAVRLAPENPAVLVARSKVYEDLHQMDEAIADLDHAIKLKPDDATSFAFRGALLLDKGDFDKADADLDRALSLKPDLAMARAARGYVYLQKFEYERSIAELDAAIKLDPTQPDAYFARARARYYLGDFKPAIADLVQSNARAPFAYSAIWLYLVRTRAGQNGRDELNFWAGRLPHDAWPFPLIEFYLGARSLPLVLSAATTNDQLCEAEFYTGEWLLLQKLDAPGVAALRKAVEICPVSYIERNGAIAELRRIAPEDANKNVATLAPSAPIESSAPQPPRPSAVLTDGLESFDGAAFWTEIAPDPANQHFGAFGADIALAQAHLHIFLTIERTRDDGSGSPYALILGFAPDGGAAPSRDIQSAIGAVGELRLTSSDGTSSFRLAAPSRVADNIYRARIASSEIESDLAALHSNAKLDVALGWNDRRRFHLLIDLNEVSEAAADKVAEAWRRLPAPTNSEDKKTVAATPSDETSSSPSSNAPADLTINGVSPALDKQ
jgi:tetratricopeptide (TPR) repeat protein/RsiW-degrading membrane proteinase PrsW (M82 family)